MFEHSIPLATKSLQIDVRAEWNLFLTFYYYLVLDVGINDGINVGITGGELDGNTDGNKDRLK